MTTSSTLASVTMSVVKHVPVRGVVWGAFGFFTGSAAVLCSLAIAVFVLDRGVMVLGYFLAIPAAIPLLGAGVFFVHGLHRGAARALLAIEQQFGLVRHVVDRAFAKLDAALPVNLAPAELEKRVHAALASVDAQGAELHGLAGWVVRRGTRAISKRLDGAAVEAFRALLAEANDRAIERDVLSARVARALSDKLSVTLMTPLNTQVKVMLALYVALGATWWLWLFALAGLLTRSS